MGLLYLCCGNKKNTIIEMNSLSKSHYENIIKDLLRDLNINEYQFTWKTSKLPCDIRYLEDKIHNDIRNNNSYNKLHIIFEKNLITLMYNYNVRCQTQIFFNTSNIF